jgi:hypothetical protein
MKDGHETLLEEGVVTHLKILNSMKDLGPTM